MTDARDDRGGPAEPLGALIDRFLHAHGHVQRVSQASVLEAWPRVCGPQIARMTEAVSISSDGTLVVAVATNAWMAELSMHEPEFLARLNDPEQPPRVRRIRWQLLRKSGSP